MYNDDIIVPKLPLALGAGATAGGIGTGAISLFGTDVPMFVAIAAALMLIGAATVLYRLYRLRSV